MKPLFKISLVLILSLAAILPASAQTKKQIKQAEREAQVKQLINAQDYVFVASYMYPLGGGQRYLNTMYDVHIGKDTVEAWLPYFGVAYAGAGYNTSEDNGIKFTSTKFDYKADEQKNGSWNIIIRPRDSRTINQLIFTIAKNGNADLSVVSNNRQRIRFDGYIKEKPKTKK